jgi:hypothetical protein
LLPCGHQLGAREPDRKISQPTQCPWIALACRSDKLLGLLSELLDVHVDLLPDELGSAASRKKTAIKQKKQVKAGTALPADRRRPSTRPRLYTATNSVSERRDRQVGLTGDV